MSPRPSGASRERRPGAVLFYGKQAGREAARRGGGRVRAPNLSSRNRSEGPADLSLSPRGNAPLRQERDGAVDTDGVSRDAPSCPDGGARADRRRLVAAGRRRRGADTARSD